MNAISSQNLISRPFEMPRVRLGFGCGLLFEAGDQAAKVRLLRAAFDAGITYFDTARLYADGLGERAVADAFVGQRSEVIITTKVGILPTPNGLGIRIRDKLLVTARKLPGLSAVLAQPKVREPIFGVFDIPRMRLSVEASLRALRTDYVDSLLLHECELANASNPEVTEFLESLVSEGKIRSWGVAPTFQQMLEIAGAGAKFGSVAQFANSAFDENLSRIQTPDAALVITHTSLSNRFRRLTVELQNAETASRWQKAIGDEVVDRGRLASVFLRYALRRNPDGIVLFSTTHPSRIIENMRALEPGEIGDGVADRLPAALKAIGF